MKRTLRIRQQFLAVCAVTFATCCCFLVVGCGSMVPPPPVLKVSITPVRGGAVTGQIVSLTASVQNDVGAAGVTWSASGGASFSSTSKTTANLVAPNATGNVTITATSVADSTKSASATIAVTDLTGVTTYHNDLSRDGANTHEFALTPSNVNTTTFGKLFSCTVDGATIKLSTTGGLSVADWFTPADQSNLDGGDTDHGSGGAAIIVNMPNGNFVIGGGKEGTLFLLNQTNMGHYGANVTPQNSNAVQVFSVGGSIFSTAAFWNNSLFIAPTGGPLQAYPFDTTIGLFKPGNATSTSFSFGNPGSAGSGATPSISSNGASSGIVWAMDNSQYCTPQSPGCGAAILHAFNATSLASELWNSSQAAGDAAGFAVKFTVPTVANGKVYIGTRGNDSGAGTSSILGELDVYGLKAN